VYEDRRPTPIRRKKSDGVFEARYADNGIFHFDPVLDIAIPEQNKTDIRLAK
jgi:hypothetical protein